MILRTAQRLRQRLASSYPPPFFSLPPRLATIQSGSANLEVIKFGIYIMFPIGWMYYFGTNLENRFQVPDFWPKPEETNKIPYERDEQIAFRDRLKEIRLENRRKRLGLPAEDQIEERQSRDGLVQNHESGPERGFGKGAIEKWVRGQ